MSGNVPLHTFNLLATRLPSPEAQRAYAMEMCKLVASATIVNAMEAEGLSRRELAERIDKTPGFVSQVLNGTRNMTLSTFAELAWALGKQVSSIDLSPLGESRVPVEFVEAWVDEELQLAHDAAVTKASQVPQRAGVWSPEAPLSVAA